MEPVIKIQNLYKDYKIKDGILHALQDININIFDKMFECGILEIWNLVIL